MKSLQITTVNGVITAPVMKTEPYEYGNLKGDLVTLLVENYGTTQPFFCSGGLTADGITERSQLSGIPKEYVNKQGKDFNWGLYGQDVTPQKKLVNAFVQQFKEFQKQGRGLYISSKAKGSGKTMLACCLANEVMKRYDLSIKFINAPDYVDLERSKLDSDREKKKKILGSSLLILDDIGAEATDQDWVNSIIFRLVDYRRVNILPTIFTSNFELDKLKCDERTVDRITEISTEIRMPEVRIRRQKAKKSNDEFIQYVMQKNNEK